MSVMLIIISQRLQDAWPIEDAQQMNDGRLYNRECGSYSPGVVRRAALALWAHLYNSEKHF